MASPDAYNSLIESTGRWEEYRSTHSGVIDLKLAEFKEFDFEGRNLSNCDFAGADFENANLDNCEICRSTFDNACLEGASLVNVCIVSSSFSHSNLKQIVVREAEMDKVRFCHANLKEAEFFNCSLHRSVFSDSDLHSVRIEMTNIEECRFNNINAEHATINDSELSKSTLNNCVFRRSAIKNLNSKNISITDVDFSHSLLDNVGLTDSNISKFLLCDASVSRFDLSGSSVSDVDLSQFDIENTILLGTAINNSVWPAQKGRTTILGRYILSPYLLGQPVQDVKGLAPSLRREIADAQYLREILRTERLTSRILLRLWGVTTGYGQSLTRLTAICALLILLLSFIFVICDGEVSPWPDNMRNGLNAVRYVVSHFIGLGIERNLVLSKMQQILLFLTRLMGFVILGLWIGLAVNRLGKLSAE